MSAQIKESGVKWVGSIPSDWRLYKLGLTSYLKGRIGWQGLNSDDFIDEGPFLVTGTDFENGLIRWDLCYHISEKRFEEDPLIHVRNGDVLFTKDGTVGKVAYVVDAPEKVSLNSHLLLIRPADDQIDNRFLYWVLQSDVFEQYKLEVQHGTVMDSVSQTNMAHFVYMAPKIEEQRWIAREIDLEVSRLDHAISLIEEQVSTLEAYRRSFTQEVVTKGLDPSVPMKDSGVEWIGSIPAHWTIRKTKHLAAISSGSTPDRSELTYWDGTIPWVRTGELQNNVIVDTELKITGSALRNCSLRVYEPGTLLIAMYGQGKTRGMTGMLGIRSTTNQACAALVANADLITPDYLWAAFQGSSSLLVGSTSLQ